MPQHSRTVPIMQLTRGTRVAALIARTDEIEDLARRIQESDEATAPEVTRQAEAAYRGWYADARALLPEEIAKKFQFE